MRPTTTPSADDVLDRGIPQGVSMPEAERFAEQRLAAAPWWWATARDLIPASDRDVLVPVLALLEFSFSLGGDSRDSARVQERWTWWRDEVANARTGESIQPLLIAVRPAVEAGLLDWSEITRLLEAIAADSGPRRYETWSDLEQPVMAIAKALRTVLLRATSTKAADETALDRMIAGVLLTDRIRTLRDGFLDRDRLVTPRADWPGPEFEVRLRDSALQGWGVDRAILEESRTAIRATIERIWPWYEAAERMHESFEGLARAWCWLAVHVGARVLQKIELWNAETALRRPEVTRLRRFILGWRARRERDCRSGSA